MKKCFLVASGFLMVVYLAKGQTATDTFRIDNAYSLAKAICNPNKYAGNEDKARQLLGGLLWYMNGDENRGLPEVQALIDTHYSGIEKHFDDLVNRLQKENAILLIPVADLEKCINSLKVTDPDTKNAVRQILQKRKEYDSLVDVNTKNDNELKLNEGYRKGVAEVIAGLRDDSTRHAALNNPDTLTRRQLSKFRNDSLMFREEYKVKMSVKINLGFAIKQLAAEIRELKEIRRIQLACLMNVDIIPGMVTESVFKNELEAYKEQVSKNEVIIQQADLSPLSFKLPSQSDIIDALAIYMAKRVKQESVMWFFETLQRQAKKYELVTTFFPETVSLLQSKEVYEIPNLGSAWRYALSKDFVFMPRNLFRSQWLRDRLGKDSSITTSGLELTWDIARMVQQHYNYNDIISSLYLKERPSPNTASLSMVDFISLLYSINTEFIKKEKGTVEWMKYEDLLYMNDDELLVMLSLVDARYHSFFSKLLKLDNGKFELGKAGLNQLRRWLGLVLLKINQLDKLREEYQKYKSDDTKTGLAKFEYSDYNTWKFLQDLLKTLSVNNADDPYEGLFRTPDPLVQKTLSAMVEVQEVYSLLQQKNFAGAVDIILHTVEELTYKEVYVEDAGEIKKEIGNFKLSNEIEPGKETEKLKEFGAKSIAPDSLVRGKGQLVSFSNASTLAFLRRRNDQKAIKIVRGLTGFLNDVAQAENSKSLARVVESYALPPGSYKKKRNSWKSLDLAAYVGVYAGYEKTGTSRKGEENTGAVYGLTAPIGFSYSKTFGTKLKETYSGVDLQNPDLVKLGRKAMWRRNGTTLTAFLSIIDIGAVVSYRFNNQDTVLPQKVKWSQVISPGAHLNLGLKGTPLVFSAGVQYTPELRSFKQDTEQRNAIRFYAGILFDIPLFNLFTKSEIVRKNK